MHQRPFSLHVAPDEPRLELNLEGRLAPDQLLCLGDHLLLGDAQWVLNAQPVCFLPSRGSYLVRRSRHGPDQGDVGIEGLGGPLRIEARNLRDLPLELRVDLAGIPCGGGKNGFDGGAGSYKPLQTYLAGTTTNTCWPLA